MTGAIASSVRYSLQYLNTAMRTAVVLGSIIGVDKFGERVARCSFQRKVCKTGVL